MKREHVTRREGALICICLACKQQAGLNSLLLWFPMKWEMQKSPYFIKIVKIGVLTRLLRLQGSTSLVTFKDTSILRV